jgi:LMBR1 domain-containing protein 1
LKLLKSSALHKNCNIAILIWLSYKWYKKQTRARIYCCQLGEEMALIQIALIWVVYGVVTAILAGVASIFVCQYQSARDRSAAVTTVCIFTITSLLATVLLLPVDVALVSSTTSPKLGQRKEWATQDQVDQIISTLKIVYYTLLSLDTLLCLIVVPFTYFWYEEYDEVAIEEGTQTVGQRFWGAFKYTIGFILLMVIIFLVGFFVPIERNQKGAHFDLDFFKNLLAQNHGERALTFALGLLTTLGTLIYILYAAAGLALLPVVLIKSAPSLSAPALSATITTHLDQNRERQRQLELRHSGSSSGPSARDRQELEALVREERILVRRKRLANEALGENQSTLAKCWVKIQAVFRPFKLLGGIILLLLALAVWVSMLLSGIDKAKNSICKYHCGYILGHITIFNPTNWVLVTAAKIFPVDYAVFLLLVLLFFSSSVVGIATIGIRFLWLQIFQIRKSRTSPQALLIATVMLTLISLAINYSMAMLVAPQYSHYGPQTYCDLSKTGERLDCGQHPQFILHCSEVANNASAREVCTPSVISTFLDRMMINFSFFGVVDFWAQFVFLGKSCALFGGCDVLN